MAFYGQVESAFSKAANTYGIPYAVQNNTMTFAAGSYDEPAFSASGTKLTGSCFLMPVSTRFGGEERQYMEKGLLKSQDMKAYIPSGLEVNEAADIVIAGGSWKISAVPDGAISYYPNATTPVYIKIYLSNKKP